MSEIRRHRVQWVVASIWMLAVLAVTLGLVKFVSTPRIDTNVMALLPKESGDVLVERAAQRVMDSGTRDVLVLLGHSQASEALRAAAAYRSAMRSEAGEPWQEIADGFDEASNDALRAHFRVRLPESILTRLQDTAPEVLADEAMARLMSPAGWASALPFVEDPLGLWAESLALRAGDFSLVDGQVLKRHDGRYYAILRFDAKTPAFRVDGQTPVRDRLQSLEKKVRPQVANLEVLHVGIPLIAEGAAEQANREMNTIGLGSLAAIVLLVAVCFRSPAPVLLVGLSLFVGVATALVVTDAVFGGIHVLTLVFGATLVGVAEDYGIHYFAARQGQPSRSGTAMLDHLMPGLLLAFATSALAYAALALAPFPGLRQMAVFSAVGLLAAFATVACWFPLWPRRAPRMTRLAEVVGASLARWPRLDVRSPLLVLLLLASAALLVIGLPRLTVLDDLRALQGVPEPLLQEQRRAAEVLSLQSPAQFFIVTAANEEALMAREEALIDSLGDLKSQQLVDGWSALSEDVPSPAKQQRSVELVQRREREVLEILSGRLGESFVAPLTERPVLSLANWLAQPASLPFRSQWLGAGGEGVASVVRLTGVGPAALPALSSVELPGVRWVDRTAQYSQLLAHYRVEIQQWLCLGVLAVALALWFRFGRQAWRALVPTLLAGGLALAAQGLMGVPLQLFNVLALMLLLGVGIDYGIFLIEHQDDPASWLAVSLGAFSTLLGFGLLALSATPALESFGLTMLVGVGAVWCLAPVFRPAALDVPAMQDPPRS